MQQLLLAPIALSILGSNAPQESAAPAVPNHAQDAASLLRSMASLDLVLECEVGFEEAKKEDKDPNNMGDGVAIFVMDSSSPFGAAKAYEGNLEVVLRSRGDRLLQTSKAAPGFTVYAGSDLVLRRVTYLDQPPSLDPVVPELLKLMDLESLAKEIAASEVRVKTSGKRTIYTAPLRATFFVPKTKRGGNRPAMMFDPMMGMRPKVLEASLQLVVGPDGSCQRLDVSVLRNDPQAEMMQGMQFAEEIELDADGDIVIQDVEIDGAAGGLAIGFGGPGKAEAIEGGTSTYTFNILEMQPTKRAAKALDELSASARQATIEGR